MKINSNGFWENETAEGHEHDEGVANTLIKFLVNEFVDFPGVSVWDVGCGDGFYTNHINDASDKQMPICCWGIDGNPNTFKIAGPNTTMWDLTKPANHLWKNDWVLCLEVGEHIPQEYEDIFLDNLDKLNKYGMIISWAVPGQGGDGHINNKENSEVIDIMEKRGYSYDEDASWALRKSASLYPVPCYWLKNTIMVFRRKQNGTLPD